MENRKRDREQGVDSGPETVYAGEDLTDKMFCFGIVIDWIIHSNNQTKWMYLRSDT